MKYYKAYSCFPNLALPTYRTNLLYRTGVIYEASSVVPITGIRPIKMLL